MSDTSKTLRRLVIGAVLVGILAFAVAARVKPASPLVLRENGEVRLLGTDPYLHLRAIRYSVEHFPHVLRWDVGTSYPTGEYARTPGLYDLGVAAVALVAGADPASDGPTEGLTVEQLAAWSAPVLGALAVLALFALVRRVADSETGLLAAVLVSLYPGSFILRTVLGFADHHAAEVLLALLSAWGAAACFGSGPSRGLLAVRKALLRSLPLALVIFTWAGGPLVLLVVAFCLFLVATLAVARGPDQTDLGARLLGYGVGLFGWVAAGSALWPDLIVQPDVWPALLATCAALGPLFWAYLKVGQRLADDEGRAPLVALVGIGLMVAGLVGFVYVVPGADQWMARIFGARTELVSELATSVTAASYWRTLGVSGALAVVAPLICLRTAWDGESERPALFVCLMAGVVIALWWLTQDYDYLAAVLAAAAAALCLRALWLATLPHESHVRNAVYLGGAALALVIIWPLEKLPKPWLTGPDIERLQTLTEGWVEAMSWMAEETPELPLEVTSRVEPFDDDFHYPVGGYGVLSAWDFGNFVTALGRRPVVVSQGVSETLARWMMLRDEAESIAYWGNHMDDGERVRYVVMDADTLGDHYISAIRAAGLTPADFIVQPEPSQPPVYGDRYQESIAVRLYLGAANGLSQHRLVYQSADRSVLFYRARPAERGDGSQRVRLIRRSEPLDTEEVRTYFEELQAEGLKNTSEGYIYGAELVPSVRIVEVVPGAVIEGVITAGAELEARITLESRTDGEILMYRQATTADDQGRFRLVVPYANDGVAASSVVPTGPYRLHLGGAPEAPLLTEFQVAETEVQMGAVRRIEPFN